MRVSLGLLALCLALCYGAPAFEEGKTYIYDYEAKFGSGVSDSSITQLSGSGLRGQLKIQRIGNQIAVQAGKLKVADFNKRLQNILEVVELDYKDEDYLRRYEQPFWAEYHNGRISASLHKADLSTQEINVERAVLSLLQIIFPEKPANEHFYIVEESGIGGDCKTSYVISHEPNEYTPGAVVLNVTKNRHYDQCKYRPHYFISSLTGYKCAHCREDDFDPYKAFGRTEYQLKGTKQDFVIERIENNGLISFSPFSANGRTVLSLTNQSLVLSSIEAGSLQAAPADARKIEGLTYIHHDEEIDHNRDDLTTNHNYLRVTRPYTKEQRFKEAEEHLVSLDVKFPDYGKLIDIGHAFYNFDYQDLEEFFGKHINFKADASPAERDRSRIVTKILAYVGTNPSISFLLHLIEEKLIPLRVVAEELSVLPLYAKTPNKPLVERFRKYVETNSVVNENPQAKIYSVAYLAYGTLLFKACIHDQFNPHPYHAQTYINQEDCRSYVNSLIEKFRAAESNEQRSALLGAIKNTRSEEAYKLLITEVIPSHKYDTFLRGAAMWGLEFFIRNHRLQIVEILVPILNDVSEDYLLRIYAFEILLHSDPPSLFYANLVLDVSREPNQQVATYIYSTLSSIANSTDPCHEDIVKHARSILSYMRPHEKDLVRFSNNRFFTIFNEQYAYGRTTQVASVASNDTAFPRELYLRHSINLAGYNFDALEFGFIQRGGVNLDNALAVILKKYNLLFRPKLGGEDYNLAKHIDFAKLTSNSHFEFYASMFNQEIFVGHSFDFKESPYFTEINPGKYDIHYTKIFSRGHVEYSVPNELGFRTKIYLQTPVVAGLHGTAGYKEGKGIELDLYYVADAEVKTGIKVYAPRGGPYGYRLITNAGINLPIRGNINLNLLSHQLLMREILPTEPLDLIHYHSTPVTYIGSTELRLQYSDRPVQRQYKWGYNYFGAGYKFQFSYDYYWNDYGSYRNFLKTFIHKSTRYEDYFELIDKYYAATRGFLDYAMLNPTGRPFELIVKFEQSSTNPASEYIYNWQRQESPYYDEAKTEGAQAWRTKGIKLEVQGKGAVERKWEFELNVARHWPITDLRRLNFHYRRSALPNYDDKPYEICFNSEATVQGLASIVTNPLNRPDETSLSYSANLNAGENCGEGSRQITFKGVGHLSEEQKSLDRQKLSIYQKCKEDYSKGYEFSYACWLVRKDQGRVDSFAMDIDYSANINPAVKSCLYRLYLYFRHQFYNNLRIDQTPNADIPANHIRIQANFSYSQPILDINVYRPHETVSYKNIFVPSIIPRYEPITIAESFLERYVRRILRFRKPICILSGDYVYTLDGVVYKYPLGKCYHVAVADSLSEDILVLFKSVQDGQYTKALKVVVYDSNIEIRPEGGKLVAYVDGSPIDSSKPAYIKTVDEQIAFAVYRKFNGYVVSSQPSGLEIYFDGRNSKISVSNLYRGRQHGLCGNFNGEKREEFRAVDGTLYKSGSDFAHSYAIHKSDCHSG